MTYHYYRVSSKDQSVNRQVDALNGYKPADKAYTDKASGKNFDRTAYQRMKAEVVRGDEVIVKELDRFGRNKKEIREELEWFKDHGVTVRILDVPTTLIDFNGQDWIGDLINGLLIDVLSAIAEQERKKIHERMIEGIAAKKARGEWEDYGRPKKNVDANVLSELREKNKKGELTIDDCCRRLGISRSTWYSRLREAG